MTLPVRIRPVLLLASAPTITHGPKGQESGTSTAGGCQSAVISEPLNTGYRLESGSAAAKAPTRLPLLRRESRGTRLGETGVHAMRHAYWLWVLLFALLIVTIGLGKGAEVYSLGPSLANGANVILILLTIIGAWFARRQIRISNSIRTTELITTIYGAFLKDDLYPFYAKIRKGKTINWQHKKDERLLNK